MSAHLLIPPNLSNTYKWDVAPRNSTITSSNGNWDSITCNWTPDDGYHNVPWVNGNIASFDGTAIVTVPNDITCGGITVANNSVSVSKTGAGALNLVNAVLTNNGTSSFNNISLSSGTINISGTTTSNSTFGITISGSGVLNILNSATLRIFSAPSISTGSINLSSGVVLTSGSTSFGCTYKNVAGDGGISLFPGSISSQSFFTNSYNGNTILQATNGPAIYVKGTNPFGSGVGSVTLTGSTHYIQTDTTSNNVTIPNNIILNNATQTDGSLGTGGITYSGVISGSSNLTKVLGGTITLSNTGNTATGTLSPGSTAGTLNVASWAGPIPLNVGSVVITNSCTIGNLSTVSATGTLTINSGVILTVNQTSNATITNRITGTGTLRKTGGSTLTLNNVANDFGALTLLAGTLAVGNLSIGTGTLTFNGGTFSVTAGNLTFSNNVVMSSTGAINTTQTTAQTTTFSGVISGSGNMTISTQGDISNSGGGAAGLGVSFTNVANTYSGNITVNAGLINRVSGSSFGSGSITLNGGGIVDTVSTTVPNNIVLGASGGTIRVYASATSTFSGGFTGSGTLSKTDSGILLMSNTGNTFTGNVLVKAGTMRGVGSVQGINGCYGAANTDATKIQIISGAVLDNNGMGSVGGSDLQYGITIAGTGISGSCWINSGASASLTQIQSPNVTLSANASIGSVTGATGNIAMLAAGFGTTTITLGTFILTKVGSNTISLINTTISSTLASSNIVIAGGTISTDSVSGGSFSASTATITLNNTSGVVLACSRNATIGNIITSGSNSSITIASGMTITVGNSSGFSSVLTNISGAGGLTFTGSSAHRVNSNSFTGPVLFNGTGIIRYGTTSTPFGTSSGITVNSSCRFASDINSLAQTISIPVSISSGRTLTIDGGYYPVVLSGIISGSGNISGISSGTVTLSNNGNTCSGTLTTSNTAGHNMNITSWVGPVTINNGNLIITNTCSSGNLSSSSSTGSITINSSVTWTITKTSSSTISNVISGSGNFVLTGTGTNIITTISGTNTITGGITIQSNGYMSLTGSFNTSTGITVIPIGIISGDSAQTGSTSNLTFSALASKLICNAITVSSMSRIAVTGTITAASGFTVDLMGTMNAGTYTLISNTGTLPVTLPTLGANTTGRTPTFIWNNGVGLEVQLV